MKCLKRFWQRYSNGTKGKIMKQERLLHFDLLRILACFSVIVLHAAAQFWYGLPIDSTDWLVVNSYNAVFRFGVPVFVAISGALFLAPSREVNMRKLFLHNILRLVILYFVWSALYGLYDCRNYEWSQLSMNDILMEIFLGRYHLWYLPMIVGIYMLVPILKRWVTAASRREVEYFLLLFLVFQILQGTIMAIKPTEWMKFVLGAFDLQMACSYLGYFVLGYYVVYCGIGKKWHPWIYLAGVLGAVANILLSAWKAAQTGAPDGVIFDSFGLFTFLMVLAVLMFFTEKVSKVEWSSGTCCIIREISSATLGIYLMHLMWMEFLMEKGIHSTTVTPWIGVPMISVVSFCLCFTCAAFLRRIPFLGRYLC